jgi:cob(I)alamin adenosyltransferase
MKIYTGTGDRGNTGLLSGERISKSHARIEAYGDLDELNSVLGALASNLPPEQEKIRLEIHRIQSDLFHAGARLATASKPPEGVPVHGIGPEKIRCIESAIDDMEEILGPLRVFVLPGGHPAAAWAHIARTVCRRAERRVVHLARIEDRPEDGQSGIPGVRVYLNRLSDYLFVLARLLNRIFGVADIPWRK